MKPEFLADLIDRFFDAAIAPFAARLAALECRPAPQDGKSVIVDDVRPMVEALVDERVKSLLSLLAKDADDSETTRFIEAFQKAWSAESA